jgi:hypothetical protein
MDYIEKIEKKAIKYSRDIYEKGFYIKDLNFEGDKLIINKIRSHSGKKVVYKSLSISPVSDVIWKLSDNQLNHLINANPLLVITNFSLVKSYVTDLKYSIIIEGFSSWVIKIIITKNQCPHIELN